MNNKDEIEKEVVRFFYITPECNPFIQIE